MLDEDNADLLASASEIQTGTFENCLKITFYLIHEIIEKYIIHASFVERLYFVAFKKSFKPKNTVTSHYFTIDDDLVYENFYNDFGPLNICMLYRYCERLNEKLHNKMLANKKIIHYTSMNPAKRVNAAYLVGSYTVILVKYASNSKL